MKHFLRRSCRQRKCDRESVVALMAEEKQGDESVKLFVGQVPKHMTEDQILAMFQEFALVDEVNIIKDKTTRASRGLIFNSLIACFLNLFLDLNA